MWFNGGIKDMIHFFPTPYPEELWLSVLCRYHVRSGNIKFATTMEDLFGVDKRWTISAFFPTNAIHKIISQLPTGFLDIRSIILNHTLFSYYLRMVPTERKEKILNDFCRGKGETLSWIWSSERTSDSVLRYCPLCCQEDIKAFGEPYWHTSHQLPLLTVCVKHKCKLESVIVGKRKDLNIKFFLPNEFCVPHFPNYEVKPHEILLANILDSYYRLPITVGPTAEYSNLAIGLSNAGYMDVFKRYHFIFNKDRVYNDLIALYGQEQVEKVFGKEMAHFILARIANWTLLTPERYAMLSAMINQSAEVMFGPKIPDLIEERIKNLKVTSRSKKDIAAQVGVKTYQLDALFNRYGLDPIWDQKPRSEEEKRRIVVKLYCTQQEKEELEAFVKERDFPNISEMLRYCFFKAKQNS